VAELTMALPRVEHFTIGSVSDLYGVTRKTLYEWIAKGLIPEPVVRPGSRYRSWHPNQLPLIAQLAKSGVKGRRKPNVQADNR
jgi:DNA-binding transcriptional MerR regulator